MNRTRVATLGLSAGLMFLAPLASAEPLMLDQLWDPYYGGHVKAEGYLEFINPTEHPNLIGTPVPSSPPGQIQTEEYTGYTTVNGQDIIELGDSDTTAGDRADFDWVQENRPCETTGGCSTTQPVNHPGQTGAMGWTVGTTEPSPHMDQGAAGGPGTPHNHSDEENPPGPLPHLVNNDYPLEFFNAVDVFSIISLLQDVEVIEGDPSTYQLGALDYVLDFANTITGAFSQGVLSVVWMPGWTNATYIDDYVARWLPATPGLYNVVAIEPAAGLEFAYEATEIDAIKGLLIPAPGSVPLMGLGLLGLAFYARRRSA